MCGLIMTGLKINYDYALNKLKTQFYKYGRLIIAFDFDDTVHPTWVTEKDVAPVVDILLEAYSRGHILYCCTANGNTEYIKTYLESLGLPAIVPDVEVGNKPYFNILIDDKAGLEYNIHLLRNFLNWEVTL